MRCPGAIGCCAAVALYATPPSSLPPLLAHTLIQTLASAADTLAHEAEDAIALAEPELADDCAVLALALCRHALYAHAGVGLGENAEGVRDALRALLPALLSRAALYPSGPLASALLETKRWGRWGLCVSF